MCPVCNGESGKIKEVCPGLLFVVDCRACYRPLGIVWRRFLARLVISIIRRHFSEGISGIVGSHTTWSWSDEFERSVFNRGTANRSELRSGRGLEAK